ALSESGGLDVFVVGTGQDLLPLASVLRAKLRAAGVGCETMATCAAVRTYNMLVDEDRRVGALLIAV
ncbi:MAG: MTH938/NDUFAF3 family protein, partial [Methylocystis sp.]